MSATAEHLTTVAFEAIPYGTDSRVAINGWAILLPPMPKEQADIIAKHLNGGLAGAREELNGRTGKSPLAAKCITETVDP